MTVGHQRHLWKVTQLTIFNFISIRVLVPVKGSCHLGHVACKMLQGVEDVGLFGLLVLDLDELLPKSVSEYSLNCF
jgi:hypothetical protein